MRSRSPQTSSTGHVDAASSSKQRRRSSGSRRRPLSRIRTTRSLRAVVVGERADDLARGRARAGERELPVRLADGRRAGAARAAAPASARTSRTSGSRSMIPNHARHVEAGGRDRDDARERQRARVLRRRAARSRRRASCPRARPASPPRRRRARSRRARTRPSCGEHRPPGASGSAAPKPGRSTASAAAVGAREAVEHEPPGVGAVGEAVQQHAPAGRRPRAPARGSSKPASSSRCSISGCMWE